jgi:hypothetical protein
MEPQETPSMTETKTVAGAYAKIESHEELCAERYTNIHTTLEDLKGSSKALTRTAWGVLLAVLAFLAQQFMTSNSSRLDRLERPTVTIQNRQAG